MNHTPTLKRGHRLAWSVAGMLLPLPCLMLFVVFAVSPLVFAAVLSFASWSGGGPVHWVGLTNWQQLFASPASQSALWRTLVAAVVSWVIEILFGATLGIDVAGPSPLP